MLIRNALCAAILMAFILGCGILGSNTEKSLLTNEERVDVSEAHEDEVVGDVLEGEVKIEKSQLKKTDLAGAVASYKRLLTQNSSPSIRSEALRRLADLTMRLTEMRELALIDGVKESELSPELREASYDRALSLYAQLVKENPDYHDLSSVQYQMAKAHQLGGKQGASLGVLEVIAENYPKSAQIAETHFRRGEIYFSGKSYNKALDAYEVVVERFNTSKYYRQALYKLGWSYYKLNEFDAGLKKFFQLLELLQGDIKKGNAAPIIKDLLNDTYRVVSLSFYQMDGPQSVEQHFSNNKNKSYELDVYKSLAKLYIEHQRFKDAADTNAVFIKNHPFHDQAPELQTEIIKIYSDGGFPSLILPSKEQFVTSYGRNSAYWNKATVEKREQLKPFLKAHLLDVASFYHAKAQKTKKAQDYLLVTRWYREYLLTFPKSENFGSISYLLAEALFDGGFFKEAIVEFGKIAYSMQDHPKRNEAAYQVLVCYQELIKRQPENQRVALDKQFVSASLRYVKAYRTQKEAATVLSNTIELQLKLKDVVGALASSRDLLENQKNATLAMRQRAQIVIANGEFDLGNYRFAEDALSRVLSMKGLTQKQRKQFSERKAQAIYKQGEEAKKKGNKDEAIKQFLRVAKIKSGGSTKKSAQFDAATLLLEQKKWVEAIPLLLQFRRAYPKDKLQQYIPEKLYTAYESLKKWPQAAGELKRIADREKKGSKVQSAAYWRVAELYEKAGQPNRAIVAYKFYARNVPRPMDQNIEAKYKLVTLYDKKRDARKRDFWRKEIIKTHKRAAGKTTDRLRYLAAESEFNLAKPVMRRYKSIQLTQPLKRSLTKKQQALQAALKAYGAVLDYGVVQFRTAASYQIGDIYYDLSQKIMNSQRPKGMDAEALEEYEIILEERAIPFEDKAVEAHIKNTENTTLKIYDKWVKESFKDLSEISPARFDKQEVIEDYVEQIP